MVARRLGYLAIANLCACLPGPLPLIARGGATTGDSASRGSTGREPTGGRSTSGGSTGTAASSGSTGGDTSAGGGGSTGSSGAFETVGLAGVIAGGSAHTCALVSGGVLCWGSNDSGQLGNNGTNDSDVPVAVVGLGSPGSGVQALVAGNDYTCALVNGGVKCWGLDTAGQLGNNSIVESHVPVAVQGIGSPGSGVQAIAGGDSHVCALVGGGVQCWGFNSGGQLGNNSMPQSTVPVAVQGLGKPDSGVQALAAGGDNTCALVNGGLQCWGDNSAGQLGNNSSVSSAVPIAVQGIGGGVQAFAVGFGHVCALVSGGVWCWGDNLYGALGNGSNVGSGLPVAVLGEGGGVSALAAGQLHTCALAGGGLQCWGGNFTGQLGNNSTVNTTAPVVVQGLGNPGSGVQAVAAGYNFTCALVNGAIECWGANSRGELGDSSVSASSSVPVAVQGLGGGIQAVTAGGNHTCALVNGGAQCWGDNGYGEIGNNSLVSSLVPAAVEGLSSGVQALAAGRDHACALANGGVWCWGDNTDGQLGNNSSALSSGVPVAVQGLGSPDSGVQAIAAGYDHNCALVNGGVQCWGWNYYGQLGDGSEAGSNVPVSVQNLGSGVQALACGGDHSCALVNGGVQCWGQNGNGQLGNGSDAGSSMPVPVQTLGPGSGVQAIAAGLAHTCALVNGGVRCWGSAFGGALGTGPDAGDSSVPVAVFGLGGPGSGVQALAAGANDTCALVNGGVWCWGDNASGDLGNNSTSESAVPLAVQGLGGGVESLAAGEFHNCALVGGGVQCWGANSQGQLGNDSNAASGLPVPVAAWVP